MTKKPSLWLMLLISVFASMILPVPTAKAMECPEGMSDLDCQALKYGWEDWVPYTCGDGSQGDQSSSTVDLTGDHAEVAFRFFLGQKHPSVATTPEGVAGLIGNLIVESGDSINPRLNNGGAESDTPQSPGLAWGIVQWMGGRQDNLKKFAASQNKPMSDFGVQLQFAWEELKGPYSAAWIEANRPGGTADSAATAFDNKYEISGGAAIAKRQAAAREALKRYGGLAAGSVNLASLSDSNNTCCPTDEQASADGTAGATSPSQWKQLYAGGNAATAESAQLSAAMGHGPIGTVRGVIIHYTQGDSGGIDLARFFSSQGRGLGIQFNVDRSGTVYQYFPINAMETAWHVGSMNPGTIGIEISGANADALMNNAQQFQAVSSLVKFLCDNYKANCGDPKGDITGSTASESRGLLGHDEAPGGEHIDPDYNPGASNVDRTDSSKHPYMMKLRKSLGYNPTPGKDGSASDSTPSSTATNSSSGVDCKAASADDTSGSGTASDHVGTGDNRGLAIEAVRYATKADPKFKYVWGGGHGSSAEINAMSYENGIGVDCSGFIRYIINTVYNVDVGSMVVSDIAGMSKYFQKISADQVAAGDLAVIEGTHVDFVTDVLGGGKIHVFGAQNSNSGIFGYDRQASEYNSFYRYIGPKKTKT